MKFPLGWMCVEKLLNSEAKKPMLYIHLGGLLGNTAMIPSYQAIKLSRYQYTNIPK
ncbi:hypothetical protein [Shewanella pealeana]|uniref:hypothetical protein n=1 Tax=Shewanella pealeana TaxID=70864 RepID=UPI0002E0D20E|nr:hypothetical protein [Shewanella pealeana]